LYPKKRFLCPAMTTVYGRPFDISEWKREVGKPVATPYQSSKTKHLHGHYTSRRSVTKTIVDQKGHLLRTELRRPRSAFNEPPKLGSGRYTVRWPEGQTSFGSSATMGYKGIISVSSDDML